MAKGVRRKGSTPTAGSTSKRSRKTLDLAWNDDNDDAADDNDHIHSDDDSENGNREPSLEDEDESEEEALDAKKVRLAREYLEKIDKVSDDGSSTGESEMEEHDDENDSDTDRVGRKLQRDRLKREGMLERQVADKLQSSIAALEATSLQQKNTTKTNTATTSTMQDWMTAGHTQLFRGHDLTVTSVALQPDGTKAISGSKDHSVLLWDVQQGKRLATLTEHWKKTTVNRSGGQVLSVALSDDGRYAAVGKADATVTIFDVRSRSNGRQLAQKVQTFEGHKGPVTGLAFQSQSLNLFSASADRCIRHYNLQDMMYMETLYGHQSGVTDIDCGRAERPISVGRDRTSRGWKLAEDTHLIFRGGSKIQSADSITVLKDDWFLTGHEDGHLCLWMTEKKKAVTTLENAHGLSAGGLGNGVLSVASLRGSDVAASGSNDGYLRFWKPRTGKTLNERGLDPLCNIPMEGHINGIAFGPKAKFCVVAVGQEHKFGRYGSVKGAKNRFGIVQLQSPDAADDDDDEESEDEVAKDAAEEEASASDDSDDE
jgi:ribosomal RNA-processing protein 9